MKNSVRNWLTKTLPSRSAEKRLPAVPLGTRIYAIGDIHGRIDLLDALLARIDADIAKSPVERPIQIFLGDYVDRGPESRQVIERLIERTLTHNAICLKGNHEAFVLEFLEDPTVFDNWRQFGGLPTLISYGLAPPSRLEPSEHKQLAAGLRQAMPEKHHKFLTSLPMTFSCGDYFFVHAGVRPRIRLDAQKEEDLLWIREDFLLSNANFGKMIVHGHTPVETPDVRKNRINIDTGAYASGNLTCLVLEGEGLSFI